MTVLIGFSCPEFAILGADGRGVSVHDSSDVDDSLQKLIKTDFGIIAGAGRTDIIYALAARLKNCVSVGNRELSEIVRAEIEKLGLPPDDPGLQRSLLLATSATNTPQGVQTILALAEPSTNYSFDRFHHNRVVILSPAGMSDDVRRQLEAEAQAQLDQRTGKSASEKHIPTCIQMIADLVKVISKLNNTVGPRWSVGIHLARDNGTGISNVGDNVNDLQWH
jgi:hypothetical protein